MSFIMPSPFALVLVAAVVAAAYLIYQASLPKPLPGIPYKKSTATRPFGDLPDIAKYVSETKLMSSFMVKRAEELGSPIVQVFGAPFGKPWVVLTDNREYVMNWT